MISAAGRVAARLLPWLIWLSPALVSAQEGPPATLGDHRLQAPFASPAACVEFARGQSTVRRAQPAAERICNEIDRVWQDPAGAKPPVDDPLRIDFGARFFESGREPAQGILDGAQLARILRIPQLLPPRLDSGLVLENLIVTGTLDFTEAVIETPLVFRHALFRPRGAMLLEDHFSAVAIRLDRASFAGALEIRDSDIAGHLLIDDSTFAAGLTLANVVISSRGVAGSPALASHVGTVPALRVRHSRFAPNLSLANVLIFNPPLGTGWSGQSAAFEDVAVASRLELRALYAEADFQIEKSEFGTLHLADFRFAGNFILEHNRMTRMEISDGRFLDTPYVNQNRARQSVTLSNIGIHLQPDDFDPEFAVNQIGGSFLWQPSALNANVGRIDLTYNRVDGLASVFPPSQSTAEIDLSNVQMPTRLEIGRSYWYLTDESARRELYRPADDFEDFCPATDDGTERRINLTNASIDILAWNFPIGCSVRWDGAGLSYAYWGDPDLKGGTEPIRTEEQFVESLKQWRFAMQEPNSEALDFMSSYLDSRGRFSDSRDLQQDAKEVNYRPQHAFDLGWVVYALLWPTGFGVKPELALFWLFVGWLTGGAVYALYRWRSGHAGWPPPAASSGAGLQEAPARFVAAADEGRVTPVTLETTEQPSLVAGFMQYQRDRRPADFSIWAFSADAMLPVINLHAYTEYYPKNQGVRFLSFVQHIVGWWMLSIFLASATIL